MTRMILLLALFALTVAGCGNSEQGSVAGKAADDATKFCPAIDSAGLAKQCVIDTRYGSVDVIVDSFDDQVARNACDAIAGKLKPLTVQFSGKWKLQVFSPYRSDKPMASCALN